MSTRPAVWSSSVWQMVDVGVTVWPVQVRIKQMLLIILCCSRCLDHRACRTFMVVFTPFSGQRQVLFDLFLWRQVLPLRNDNCLLQRRLFPRQHSHGTMLQLLTLLLQRLSLITVGSRLCINILGLMSIIISDLTEPLFLCLHRSDDSSTIPFLIGKDFHIICNTFSPCFLFSTSTRNIQSLASFHQVILRLYMTIPLQSISP